MYYRLTDGYLGCYICGVQLDPTALYMTLYQTLHTLVNLGQYYK